VVRSIRDLAAFTSAVADLLTDLSKLEILQGKLIQVQLDGTANTQSFPHGLGRAYRGGFLVGNGSLTSGTTIAVASGKRAAQAGVNINAYFTVQPTAVHDGYYLVWVF